MKFLCLAYLDRGLSPGPDVASRYGALAEAMIIAGVIVDSGQLAPSSESKMRRIADGKTDIADGPVVDATSHPSAYFLIDCASLDDALQWAARIPAATYGTVEVRPPRAAPRDPPTTARSHEFLRQSNRR
jgi:hypothetical protein